jgi:iron complex outermembrane receptor protein
VVATVLSGNSLGGTSYGLETAIVVRPSPRFLVLGDYSYLSLVLGLEPGSRSLTDGRDEEGSSPRHQLHLRSAVSLASRLELSAGFRWQGRIRTDDVSSHAELDARLAWRPKDEVEVAVVGRNLLHAHHLEFVGDAALPSEVRRAALATVRLRW